MKTSNLYNRLSWQSQSWKEKLSNIAQDMLFMFWADSLLNCLRTLRDLSMYPAMLAIGLVHYGLHGKEVISGAQLYILNLGEGD